MRLAFETIRSVWQAVRTSGDALRAQLRVCVYASAVMEEKKKKRRTGKTFWHREATNVLKSAIERKGVANKTLADRLELLGVQIESKKRKEPGKTKSEKYEDPSVRALRNKVNRGSFSFIFYLQCLHALGYVESDFKLAPPPPPPKPSKP